MWYKKLVSVDEYTSETGESLPTLQRVLKVIESANPDALGDALTELTNTAATAIPGAQYAGITLADDKQKISTPAMSHPYAQLLDSVQNHYKEGPCLEAARSMHTIYVVDLGDDDRWPQYRSAALRDTPIRSILSLPMFAHSRRMGALNVYAERPAAFSGAAFHIGSIYAALGTLVWGSIATERQYQTALATRDTIGQAKGLLMERYRISSDASWNTLKKLSQDTNTPLREVAARLVAAHNNEL